MCLLSLNDGLAAHLTPLPPFPLPHPPVPSSSPFLQSLPPALPSYPCIPCPSPILTSIRPSPYPSWEAETGRQDGRMEWWEGQDEGRAVGWSWHPYIHILFEAHIGTFISYLGQRVVSFITLMIWNVVLIFLSLPPITSLPPQPSPPLFPSREHTQKS